MTRHEILRRMPNASEDFIKANADIDNICEISDSKSECNETPALGATVQGEKQSLGRITGRIKVGFTLYRVRPLDPDAAAGSTKDLLDGIRRASLIPEDNPWEIRLEVEQEKVRHYKDERTVITITYP